MIKINKILIKKILYWLFFLFLVYLIFELIRTLTGGSLGFEELVIALLVANLGYSFYSTFYMMQHISRIESKISEHVGWHRGKATGR